MTRYSNPILKTSPFFGSVKRIFHSGRTPATLMLFLLLITSNVTAQVNLSRRSSFITAGTQQIKDASNIGLVFTGPAFNYGMSWNLYDNGRLFSYEFELGTNIMFSKEIPAIGFYLKPADLSYMFRIPVIRSNFYIGPAFKLEYNYNLYPDLQSGFDYWFTNIGAGINAVYDFSIQNAGFRIKINSILLGFTSRQPDYRNPYFYDIGFSHAIKHLHQDLAFGSLNAFNTSSLELLWRPDPDSRLVLGYEMKYSGYYAAPGMHMINHNIKLIINRK